eukprot:463564_1
MRLRAAAFAFSCSSYYSYPSSRALHVSATTNAYQRWDVVSSISNSRVKAFRAYGQKRKLRDRDGLVLVEGVRLLTYILTHGHDAAEITVSKEALESPEGSKLGKLLNDISRDRIVLASPAAVARACFTTTPQGCVGLVKRPNEECLPFPTKGQLSTILVCDGISDPGNLGTLFRSAAGMGADAVILVGYDCADPWGPKCLRAGMGATFRLPSLQVEEWEEAKMFLNPLMSVFAGDTAGQKVYYEAELSTPCIIVVGGEARGLSPGLRLDIQKGAATSISMPLLPGSESINAGVAGSILLAEAQRQRTRNIDDSQQ